ncbi:MAG: hypothetical protein A2Y07_01185 [Planctomycetes bacterium GWF2_50_10]|nr:MAG: hypothetical protein A2Y07_01185 [Planctomycetes bacterium GWF2_50_10]
MDSHNENHHKCKWEWIGGKLYIYEPLGISEALELMKHLRTTLTEKATDVIASGGNLKSPRRST